MLRLSILLATLLLLRTVDAQIAFGGHPLGLDSATRYPEDAVVEFPSVDADRLLAEDAEAGTKGPLRFGVNHSTDLTESNSGVVLTFPDGTRVWRLVLHCPQARSINFVFGEYVVPAGARVFVRNTFGDVLGAFTQASSGGRSSLGVVPLSGDRITIQFERPPGTVGEHALRISQVTHGYRGMDGDRDLGGSGPCNNNTICPEGDPWSDQIASTAMIVANGNGWCSGQLINNCANNGTPYFLTANHCLSGQSPTNWTFRFNWASPTCDPTAAGALDNTVSGATLLESDPGSDVALLQLNTAPPASYNVHYSGWDATGQLPGSTAAIHHPNGDVKKITFDHQSPVTGEFDGAACWHILAWDDGTTEGGSSGGGLWNPQGRLIGQLFGGQASCGNNVNDYFGRFDLSYPLLTNWLGSCGLPVIDGYDPNLPAPALDASLLTISGIEPNLCNTNTITPIISVRNNGTSTLTQLTIQYDVDGTDPLSYLWNGTLLHNATTAVQLPEIVSGSGTHTFTARCISPNGGVDGQPSNDVLSTTFHVASPGETITLTLHTDDYGSETTWQVLVDGTTLYSGGPYADVDGGTVETAQFCLEEACFTFNVMDAVGDGFCCQWGNGDYAITDSDGDLLLAGDANFQWSSSTQFCSGEAAIDEAEAPALLVFPDPSDGFFHVRLPVAKSEVSLTVRDLQGREVLQRLITAPAQQWIDLSRLPSGRYFLEASDPDMRAVRGITIIH